MTLNNVNNNFPSCNCRIHEDVFCISDSLADQLVLLSVPADSVDNRMPHSESHLNDTKHLVSEDSLQDSRGCNDGRCTIWNLKVLEDQIFERNRNIPKERYLRANRSIQLNLGIPMSDVKFCKAKFTLNESASRYLMKKSSTITLKPSWKL